MVMKIDYQCLLFYQNISPFLIDFSRISYKDLTRKTRSMDIFQESTFKDSSLIEWPHLIELPHLCG